MIEKEYIKNLISDVLIDMDETDGKENVFYSENAVAQLLRTGAVESDFWSKQEQIDGGALSGLQIERPTFKDLQRRYGKRFSYICRYNFEMLKENMILSIMIARLKYFDCPLPIPDKSDVRAQGRYWKKYYNSPDGKGTIKKFIEKANRYVGEI